MRVVLCDGCPYRVLTLSTFVRSNSIFVCSGTARKWERGSDRSSEVPACHGMVTNRMKSCKPEMAQKLPSLCRGVREDPAQKPSMVLVSEVAR